MTRKAERMMSRWMSTSALYNDFLGCEGEDHVPSLAEVASAAALATHGYLTSNSVANRRNQRTGVKNLRLVNLDISNIPAEDMTNLVKCMSDFLLIDNVHGNLSHVLRNIKRGRLSIRNMKLTSEDTEHLRFAMVHGARSVSFGDHGSDVTLDMDTLAQYDGKGKCHEIVFCGSARSTYRDRVICWAGEVGWQIYRDDPVNLTVMRNLPNGHAYN